MVLLVNNQASPLPTDDEAEILYVDEGDVPPLKTNSDEDADSLSLKTKNDGIYHDHEYHDSYVEDMEEREDSNDFTYYDKNWNPIEPNPIKYMVCLATGGKNCSQWKGK